MAVPYLRVSTDDKGQDPDRQLHLIKPWADREGLILLKPAVDNGTSGSKIPALKRPVFLEACERAKAAGAEAIVMEVPDRFSRQDPDVAIWEKVEVERRYGLKLYFACMTLDMQTSPMGKVFLVMQQTSGYIWVEDHRKKVLSGNERARARGQKLGRKPKEIALEEVPVIEQWRKDGHGWETVANLLNELRGVHRLTDKKVAKARSISASALKRWDAQRRETVPVESSESVTTASPAEIPPAIRSALEA